MTASHPRPYSARPVPPRQAKIHPSGSRRLVRLLVTALVTAIGTAGAFLLYARLSRVEPALPPTTASLDSPYRSEEHWLVTRTAEDLWGLATFAASGRAEPARVEVATETDASGQLTVGINSAGKTLSGPLRLAHSVWSPEDYQPLASQLLGALGGARLASPPAQPAVDSPHEESLLRHLLDLRAGIVDDENWAISRALARQPAESRLHEDAALVLGAFALREADGEFSDVRLVLCRMTAHLALARALRGAAPLGLSGRYAEAALSTLSEREAEAESALSRLAAAAPDSPVQQAWRRALQIRITEDWRLLPHPEAASRLELFEWLRAARSTLSGERALQILERGGVEPEPQADWALALQAASVGIGNTLLDPGLDALLAEADEIWSKSRGAPMPPGGRIAALNEPAQPFLSSEGAHVIAWGTWAAQYQRHTLQLLKQIERHERTMLGLRDTADRTVSSKTSTFSGLTLFPVLAARWEAQRKKPDPQVLDAALNLVLKHPELVNNAVWSGLAQKTVAQALPRRLPARASWFTTGSPRGTTFEIDLRLDVVPRQGLSAYLAGARALSPRNYLVVFDSLSERYTVANPPPPDVTQQAFGERLDYDRRALNYAIDWAYEQDQAVERRLYQRLCEIDPDKCARLAAWCVEQGDEACAVTAYERFFAEAADDVMVSNNCEWLLWHYLRRGDRERAGQLARRAAEVGSEGGMMAMAAFLEATGQYARAEDYIKRARERYPPEDDGPDWYLIAFYHRMAHVRGVRSYEARFAKAAKDVFPNGVERADLSSLPSPPTDGVLFQTETPALRRNGMKKGDVAVAWDGWRVRNTQQFHAAREFAADPSFKLIVWRDQRYVEIPARRVGHNLGMRITDYRPKR